MGLSGSATYSNGTFTVQGAGLQIYGTADAFHYVYQSLSGDWTIAARVVSVQGASGYGVAGVMIRETLDAGARNAKTADWPAYGGIGFDLRTSPGGNTGEPGWSSGSLPYWVKVMRSGSNFSAYRSADGVNWTQLGSTQSFTMAQSVYVGLVVASGSTSALATATFDNVTISPGPPSITSITPVSGEPGTAVTISGNDFTATSGMVSFNGQSATISSWSSSSIVATVPSGVTSGNIVVSVGGQFSNGVWFGVLRPAIATLNPAAGNAGTAVTITGNHFGSSAGTVSFNGQSGTISSWSDTSIVATVPANASTGNIVVSNGGLQSNGVNFVVGPFIMGLSPGSGSAGTAVGITGFNFGNFIGGLTFNGLGATASSWNNTNVAATVPSNATTGPVVLTPQGGSASTGPIFVVPTVNGIWDQADIGTVGAAGSVSVNNGVYTVSSYSGSLGGTTDSLHYIFQPAAGDFDMIVHTSLQTESNSSMQWGITVRDSLAPGGLSFSCLYEPGSYGGDVWRATVNGAANNQVTYQSGTNLQWLRVRRYGSTFQCLGSNNGTAWGLLQPAEQVGLSRNALAGMSVMSANQHLAQVAFDTVSLTPSSGPLPNGWWQQDLGTNNGAGDANYNGGVFTVASLANSFPSTSSDNVHYVYQAASGDFDVITHINWDPVIAASYVAAGIMARPSLTPDDLQVSCLLSEGSLGGTIYSRSAVATTNNAMSYYSLANTNVTWLRMIRRGSLFDCYGSTDGVNWTFGAGAELNVPNTIEVGLVESDGYGNFSLAQFSNVSVNGIAPLPGPWQQQDIGGNTGAGDGTMSNSVFTVESNSYDIASTADNLHYVYQQATGDLNIVARVTWQQTTSANPKAGVMVRQSLAGSDLQFSCLLRDTGTVYALWRTASAGTDQSTAYNANTPYWVKINRQGSTFTCYASSNGTSWITVQSATVAMNSDVYVGLAQSSGDGNYSLTAIDNVTLQANLPTVAVTYPVNGSTVYLSQPLVLTANANPSPGASIVKVQYFEGQTLLGQATTAPYTLNLGLVPEGSHSYTAQVTDSAGLTASSATVSASILNPQITAVTPNYGQVGTLVKITGTGFGASGAGVSVTFNGVPGAITGFNNNEADVVVPSGAGSGQLGMSFPDGANADGAPNFGPCPPGAECVTSFVVSPTVIPGDGSQSVSGTVTISPPAGYTGPGPWGAAVNGDIWGYGYQCVSPATFTQTGLAYGCDSPGTSFSIVLPGITTSNTSTAHLHSFVDCGLGGGCNDPGQYATVTIVGSQPAGSPGLGSCTDCAVAGRPIDIKTGNTYIQTGDYSLPGLGGGISITRTWNSQWKNTGPLAQAGMFGDSWRATYEDRIQTTSSGVNYWLDDGKVWRFTLNNGAYTLTSPVDAHASLAFNSSAGLYTLTFLNGTKKIFGSNGYLQQVVDRNGNAATLTYDGSNRLTTITDAAGRTLNFVYGDTGNPNQVTSMQDAVGTIATYSYGSGSRLANVTYADNSQLNYTYDSNGLITSVTDALGKVLESHTYDGQRRGLTSQLANGVEAVSVSYPQAGSSQIVASAGGASSTSSYGYTQLGEKNFVTTVSGPGCASCGIRGFNQYTYDANGNVTASFDSNGVPTLFTYDGNGNVTSRSTPLNSHLVTWQYSYNSFGELLTAADPLGNATTNTYDASGNLLTSTMPAPDGQTAASVTTFVYDSKGELTTITDPLNHTTTLAYYPTGMLHTVTDAQNNVTTFNYDQRGNRTDVYDALNNHTSFAYDARNRLTAITNPDGSTVSFAYDTRGRRTSVTDGNGKMTQYAYDDADRLLSVTDANNHVTQYAYDPESNLASITDANNHVTSFSYDTQGRLTQTTFPSGKVEKYTYDNVGNLMTKIDRKNQVISYTYDTLNRLTAKTYPDSSSVNYMYDDASRLTQVQDPTGTYSFLYDNMGRLRQSTTAYSFLTGNPFTMVYGYDAASNRVQMTDPMNGVTTYSYDTLNRLTGILDFNNNNFGFGYDAVSRRTQMTRPNGITTNYGYDAVSNLLSVLHQQGANTLDGASYTYDSAGNRKSKTNLLNNAVSNFSYDNAYQLTAVTGPNPESYTYDPVGNRLTSQSVSGYAYNNSNELTTAGSASYTYDDNGNTLTKTDSTGTTIYIWDFENQLTTVQLPNSTTVSFKYDPFGRRIEKSGSNTTNYVYDGANVIEEVNQSGNLLAHYSQGAAIDEPLSELRSGAVSYYEQDGLGSVTSLSSTAGVLANTYIYDSFGNLSSSAGTITNPYQYTGRDSDPETGLRYYRARYYDSTTGRFLNEDPVQFDGGPNFYDYVNNRVTGFIDPMGLSGSKPGGPYHPPVGVHTKCLPTDDCSALAGKLWILARMISSHEGWDRAVPRPRGGNRHAPEIAQLWVQYAQCYDLYLRKCPTSCPRPVAQPVTQPANPPNTQPFRIPVIDPIADWLRDRLGELRDTIKRGPPPQQTPWGPVPWNPANNPANW